MPNTDNTANFKIASDSQADTIIQHRHSNNALGNSLLMQVLIMTDFVTANEGELNIKRELEATSNVDC